MNRCIIAVCGFATLTVLASHSRGNADPSVGRDLCPAISWAPAAHAKIVPTPGAEPEVLLDSREYPGEVGGVSPPFEIEPGQVYRLSAAVTRLAGDGRYKLAIEWFDADRRHIRYDHSWTGQLVGVEPEPYTADVRAPAEARFVAVHAGIEPGNACKMSRIIVTRLADSDIPDLDSLSSGPASPSSSRDDISHSKSAIANPPAPQPVKTRLTLGCYYFPVMLDWDRSGWGVRRVDYFEPLLGYYDEARPDVADWHIRWAVEHGISFFVFDWYYNQGFCYLNDALEKGFLASKHVHLMKFCLDWCNEGQCTEYKPLDFSHRSLESFIRTVCERYAGHPSYLKVDGRPVVLIHQAWRIANAHDGWDGCREALDRMREIARTYGHAGVYFVAVHNNPHVLRYALGGFDAVTSYAYGFCDVPWAPVTRSMPYERIVPRYEQAMAEARRRTKAQSLGFIPTGWLGWDDTPRSNRQAIRTVGNTPQAVRPMIEMLPRYVDETLNLALVEAWNEWGEGGAAEPGTQYGFGYLDVIRDVLAPDAPPCAHLVPTTDQIRAFETSLTADQINDVYYRRYLATLNITRGFSMTFDDRHGLWLRPANHVMNVRFEGGVMRCRSVGGDPVLLSPPVLDLQVDAVTAVRVTMSVTAGKRGELYWSTDDRRSFDAARCVSFDLIPDGNMHTYTIPLAAHAAWTGTIRQLRLDPTDAPADIALDHFETQPPIQ